MPDTLAIEGHASLFGLADLSGDVVAPGAFAASLATRRTIPMLFQHDPSEPIGVWTAITEDARGLHVRGEILTSGPRGRATSARPEGRRRARAPPPAGSPAVAARRSR